MNPRVRRLIADSQAVLTEFVGHPNISVIPLGSEPAEAYRVIFHLTGVYADAAGRPETRGEHSVVIHLGAGYPREKPIAVMETPIFHPNIGARVGEEVCIGDYWSPAQTLVDTIVTIGELIQYQRYNTRSPLNALAARWAVENEHIFPVGDVNLFQAEPTISLQHARVDETGPGLEAGGLEALARQAPVGLLVSPTPQSALGESHPDKGDTND